MATHTGKSMSSILTGVRPYSQRSAAGAERWLLPIGRVAVDSAIVFLAFAIAYWLRYSLEFGGDVLPGFSQPFSFFYDKVILLMIVTVAVFQLRGLYRLPRWTNFLDEAVIIAGGATTAMAIIILYSFLQRFFPSRLIFIYAWLIVILLLISKRLLVRLVRQVLWARGIGVDRVLIVGAGRAGQRIMQHIYGNPQLGYRVVGFVDSLPADENWGLATEHRVERPPYLGTPNAVGELIQQQNVSEVIIALSPSDHRSIFRLIQECRQMDVSFTFLPDLFEMALDRVQIHEVAGLPLIELRETRIHGWNYALKRAMDIAIASIVLTISAPLIALISLAIRLDSPGPIFLRQVRVGRDGETFVCYKFRSMVQDAEALKAKLLAENGSNGPLFKLKNDPRVTRVGRVLRRTSLDEIPQFFNVLLGEMSVVGPRPQIPSEVEEYEDWHYQRLQVTPGLTGLWQVNGRSDLSFDEMVKLDLYYAENWSPWLDIKLILRTIPAVIFARGAY
jgi:exopolysaccharide biosynthesis polyprenyl glycosylphosphotransferase